MIVVLLIAVAAVAAAAVVLRRTHARHVARDQREADEYRGFERYSDPTKPKGGRP